ncbi:MAG: hypothetical protein KC996_08830 [Phycisphaerales bacterium]|nr:hypothetical protein [Phycisphaerales bacterium]
MTHPVWTSWLIAAACASAFGVEPPLPTGLPDAQENSEPALPSGLPGGEGSGTPGEPELPGGLPGADEPGLPQGLGRTDEPSEEEEAILDHPKIDLRFGGFLEGRFGLRTQSDPYERSISIGETRLQLEGDAFAEGWTAHAVVDILYDPVVDRHGPDLESGEGFLDLRELWYSSSLGDHVDFKLGRQVMTWGTGDLLFINDLFPKDWNSFFIGRDEEYLKAPSDGVRVNIYTDAVNIDLAYIPSFDADRFIDGRRLSFYNPNLGRLSGRDAVVLFDRPDRWFNDDEIHYRLHRQLGAYEVAAYGYHGFWKSPGGQTPTGRATFPELNVYGASVRGPVGKGIGNIEIGYYDSGDDPSGTNGLVENSQFRFLAGYEQEIATDLTLGVQYYIEHMIDHDGYLMSLPVGVPARDESRHVLTARVTYQTDNQNMVYSLFAYVSPTDQDAYLRPSVTRKIDDHWTASVGANIFFGDEQHTFFAQFENNTNVYFSLRYNF